MNRRKFLALSAGSIGLAALPTVGHAAGSLVVPLSSTGGRWVKATRLVYQTTFITIDRIFWGGDSSAGLGIMDESGQPIEPTWTEVTYWWVAGSGSPPRFSSMYTILETPYVDTLEYFS